MPGVCEALKNRHDIVEAIKKDGNEVLTDKNLSEDVKEYLKEKFCKTEISLLGEKPELVKNTSKPII